MLPDPVDRHARGERIALAGNCVGQLDPAAAEGERLAVRAGKTCQEAPRSHVSLVLRLATNEDARVLRTGAVRERVRPRGGTGVGQIERVDPVQQLDALALKFSVLLRLAPFDADLGLQLLHLLFEGHALGIIVGVPWVLGRTAEYGLHVRLGGTLEA